jgi:hypothetical protein
MRIVVSDEQGNDVYRYDDKDEDSLSYPADLLMRAKLIRFLTDALKFLLGKRRGNLDSEV